MQGSNDVVMPPVHPGEVLRDDFLRAKNMHTGELQNLVGLDANLANAICDGTAPVTLSTAILLSVAFGTSKDVWLNLQKDYDDQMRRINEQSDPLKMAMKDIVLHRGLTDNDLETLVSNYVVRRGCWSGGEVQAQVHNLMKRFRETSVSYETFSIFLQVLWVKYEVTVTLTEADGTTGTYSVRKT